MHSCRPGSAVRGARALEGARLHRRSRCWRWRWDGRDHRDFQRRGCRAAQATAVSRSRAPAGDLGKESGAQPRPMFVARVQFPGMAASRAAPWKRMAAIQDAARQSDRRPERPLEPEELKVRAGFGRAVSPAGRPAGGGPRIPAGGRPARPCQFRAARATRCGSGASAADPAIAGKVHPPARPHLHRGRACCRPGFACWSRTSMCGFRWASTPAIRAQPRQRTLTVIGAPAAGRDARPGAAARWTRSAPAGTSASGAEHRLAAVGLLRFATNWWAMCAQPLWC